MCKIQYIGKSETSFNIRLHNHRKDIKQPNAIESCKHFNNNQHKFSKHGKFIIIEQLRNRSTTPTERKVFGSRNLNFDTRWLKPRTGLKPCYVVPVMFTLLSSFCVWTKGLMYICQLMWNKIISSCKSHLQLCTLKTATVETSTYIQ